MLVKGSDETKVKKKFKKKRVCPNNAILDITDLLIY